MSVCCDHSETPHRILSGGFTVPLDLEETRPAQKGPAGCHSMSGPSWDCPALLPLQRGNLSGVVGGWSLPRVPTLCPGFQPAQTLGSDRKGQSFSGHVGSCRGSRRGAQGACPVGPWSQGWGGAGPRRLGLVSCFRPIQESACGSCPWCRGEWGLWTSLGFPTCEVGLVLAPLSRRCPWPVVTVAWSGCGRHPNRGPCCGEGPRDYGVMSPFLPSQPL